MIRLFFPKIDFAGRVSRSVFWRELAIAMVTAPIVLGLLTYLINEFRVAATDGLAVDDARAKALAGFALTAIGLRNTVAFWSIVKRRMNDIGYGQLDIWRDSRPLYFAVVLIVIMLVGLPLGGITAILILPILLLIYWQIGRVFGFAWRLIVSPSHDGPGAKRPPPTVHEPSPIDQLGAPLARWIGRNTQEGNMQNFVRAAQNELQRLGEDAKASKIWADVKNATQDSNVLENLASWLNQPVATSPRKSSKPERRARAAEMISKRHKTIFKSPPTNPVIAARTEPKHGRSSLISGLLRGPCG